SDPRLACTSASPESPYPAPRRSGASERCLRSHQAEKELPISDSTSPGEARACDRSGAFGFAMSRSRQPTTPSSSAVAAINLTGPDGREELEQRPFNLRIWIDSGGWSENEFDVEAELPQVRISVFVDPANSGRST